MFSVLSSIQQPAATTSYKHIEKRENYVIGIFVYIFISYVIVHWCNFCKLQKQKYITNILKIIVHGSCHMFGLLKDLSDSVWTN